MAKTMVIDPGTHTIMVSSNAQNTLPPAPQAASFVVIEHPLMTIQKKNELYGRYSAAFIPTSYAALVAAGAPTGLVVDIGYAETMIVPVYQWNVMLHHLQVVNVGGMHITQALGDILCELGVAADEKRAEEIKIEVCYVAIPGMPVASDLVYPLKLKAASAGIQSLPDAASLFQNSGTAAAPRDSTSITDSVILSQMHRTAPTEILLTNIPKMIIKLLGQCPIDTKSELAANILIIGATAEFPGLETRLLHELDLLQQQPAGYGQSEKQLYDFGFIRKSFHGKMMAVVGGELCGGFEGDFKIVNGKPTDWTVC